MTWTTIGPVQHRAYTNGYHLVRRGRAVDGRYQFGDSREYTVLRLDRGHWYTLAGDKARDDGLAGCIIRLVGDGWVSRRTAYRHLGQHVDLGEVVPSQVTASYSLPIDVIERIEVLAEERGCSKSAVVAEAVRSV